MVPFSFESIARSAGRDPSNAFPVSAAARETHESFESHLQSAAASTLAPPARRPAREDEPREQSESASYQPPRNEHVRQDASEAQRDDADVRETEAREAATATETSADRNDEAAQQDAQQDAAPEDEAASAAAAQQLQAATQQAELEVSGDSENNPDRVVANGRTDASLGVEQSGLDTSLVTNADEPVDDGAPTPSNVKRVSSEAAEPADGETRTQRVNPADTNEEAAGDEFREQAQVAETTIQDDEPSKASRTQRHGSRGDISADQATRETPGAAAKPIAVDVVSTTLDTASEDGSRQRHDRKATDGTQPLGNTTAGDTTTTTPGTPSRFAQHLLARTDDPTARGPNITNADQARFVDRVARAVQATGERGGTLRLRLSPPELGALTLEVKVQGGVVSARVEADTPAARSLLLDNFPLLRERLAEQGMRVDQFDVDLSDRHAGGTPDGLQQNDQQHEDRPRAKATLHEPDEPQASSSDNPLQNGNEQLNIIV